MSVTCKQGHSHFGVNGGAAGILIYRYRDTGDVEVLIGLRKPSPTGEGISWSNFGGIIDQGESVQTAALRETYEEIGLEADDLHPTGMTVNDHDG
ncbi:hypothetical protein F4677DRAFT_439053 [Hypoxylon crocopeplum]|nr:hypothetical protein F4677DRAFT_439053 [Hypoxylon crocopeplum]